MKIKAIQCLACGDVIFSRARHDFHHCSCGEIFIDGGFDYMRIGYHNLNQPPKEIELDLDMTEKELFDDWNYRRDKYGIIKNES